MRILLVRPPRIKKAITIGEFMFCEPVGLESLYAVLKNEHTVRILDMMVENSNIVDECIAWKPDVVGLTSLCVDVNNVLHIAQQVKAHNNAITTMVGGTQTFVEPGAFHDSSIDHVFRYTTTDNLKSLITHLEEGEAAPLIDGIESKAHGFKSTGVKGRNEYMIPDITSTRQYRKN